MVRLGGCGVSYRRVGGPAGWGGGGGAGSVGKRVAWTGRRPREEPSGLLSAPLCCWSLLTTPRPVSVDWMVALPRAGRLSLSLRCRFAAAVDEPFQQFRLPPPKSRVHVWSTFSPGPGRAGRRRPLIPIFIFLVLL